MNRMPLPDDFVSEVRAMHEGDDRGYHAWSHPLDMIETLQPIRRLIRDRLALLAAIVTHDAIYDPRRQDNEEQSALYAERRLANVLPEKSLRHTARMIRATATHRPQDDLSEDDLSDTLHFLDLDLSILGADQRRFDAYEAGVRHEYRHVEWTAFATRRAGILERFLQRDHLYATEWGRTSFEARARRNLRRSIATLRLAA